MENRVQKQVLKANPLQSAKFELDQQLQLLKVHLQAHQQAHVEPTDYSLEKFLELPLDKQQEIVAMLARYNSLLKIENEEMSLPGTNIEVSRLTRAVREFLMQIVDDSILSLIEDGDVVEVYDSQGRQIYRNLMFCKLSSYSLLDVAVNTWQELYERPMSSMQGIYEKVVEQMTTAVMTRPYEVESHILKEKFIYAKSQKVFLMNMKYISPLCDVQSGQRVGVISVAHIDIIADSSNGQSIKII
jgi:PAS domain-containing protein